MVEIVVIVTGGSGLIGSAISSVVEKSSNNSKKFVFLNTTDGDLRDYEQAKSIFEKYQPTHVIHLAARVGGLFDHLKNNLGYFRDNMQINDNVLKLCFEYKVKKVVSCLSTCIFPDKTTYPIDETMIHNGAPHDSNYGFSYSKRMIDVLNKAYNEQKREVSQMFTSVVPCNVFGPNDNYGDHGHVLPCLIRRMHEVIHTDDGIPQKDRKFVVYGSGKPMRQFIYSVDVAHLILWVLDNWNEEQPIILCVDESTEVSIAEAAESIAKAFKFEGKLVFDTSKADGQFKKTASNAKIRSLLPDFKFTEFNYAIQKSVDWYLKNLEKARK